MAPAETGDLVETAFAEITSSRVKRFDLYWRSKCRDGNLPSRADIDPVEIKDLLAHFLLIDIETDPFRVRYRLCGSAVSLYDEEVTGAYLDTVQNITADELQRIIRRYRAVVEERRPVFIRRKQISRQTRYELDLQAGIWPLSQDGTTVNQCVAVEDFPSLD
ncbi:MAG TPA: PAS domain-containing protein [Dongiaceae bacterium]|nr:PAS domain-containing protein [Dongiaceae bacterium]